MTVQEATTLVSTLGFPIILVGAGLWFFSTKFWPWFVARQATNDANQAEREKAHTLQIAQTREVYERVIGVLDRMANKLDSQHVEVMHDLRGLRGKTHLEPDRDR